MLGEIWGTECALSLTLRLMKTTIFLFGLLTILAGTVSLSAQSASEPSAFAHSTQMIVVTTPDWNTVQGRLQRYERTRAQGEWLPVGGSIPIVVGKNGMAWGIGLIPTNDASIRLAADPVKKEGDGKSAAGVFALGRAFGDSSQPLPGSKMPYLSLTPSIECVDDSHSKFYNRLVDRAAVTPDWNSSEHMLDTGEAYRWGIVVGHNGILAEGKQKPPIPGGGSCIFLHIWHSPNSGTAGCTAMPQAKLETLLTWLDPARKPLLVELPAAQYGRLMHRWNLPKVVNLSSF